ncbi:MAG TPA: hypothetical protein VFL93_09810 [Longimicrobiaceae bacterium]|nr:hypothetical protein [Longimicrobiaceae bacterium]
MPGGGRARRARRAGLAHVAVALAALFLATPSARAAPPPLSLRADSLRVVYWPGQRPIAERTLRAAETPFPLPGLPPGASRVSATIVLAPDAAVFDSVTGGLAPEWSAGVAFPDERLIVLPAYASSRTPMQDPIVALRHELVHIALEEYLGPTVPRWFDEGYATWASGGWDARSGWEIRFALLRGAAPPLDSLSLEWPAGAQNARIAYLLSASAVRYLATRNGEDVFALFLRTWRAEGSADRALRSVYHLTPGRFEHEWKKDVERRYGWLLILASAGSFWTVVTFLLLGLGLLRRRRSRQKLAEMALEERMLPPPREPWGEEPGDEPPAADDRGDLDGPRHPE